MPGDVVVLSGMRGTHIVHTQHPIWPQLELVIWRLDDGSISFDALDPRQDVGELVHTPIPGTPEYVRHMKNVLGIQ